MNRFSSSYTILVPLYLGLLTVQGIAASANENAKARYDQAIENITRHAMETSANALQGVQSLVDWQGIRESKRQEFLYMLGLDPMPPRTPLMAEVTGTIHTPSYQVEKIVLQSSPGLYVTGNFYLPHDRPAPLPTIVYVCGHSPHPLGAKYHYQDRAQWFAENGYACLIIDTLEFGEVAGVHHGLHNLNMWRWLSAGFTPAGVEVWNAMRAIDYLESRSEVNIKRIGITGISGGGAVSWYTAAADERIAVAAPVCGTFTFGDQAKQWLAAGQCDCIYFNNTFQSDLSVVGALIAPRPLLLCNGRRDSIFPPTGYDEVYRQTHSIYQLFQPGSTSSNRFKSIEDDVPHQDSPALRQAARQWFHRWLKEDSSEVEQIPNPVSKRFNPEELACLTSPPWSAKNYGIHDQFVPQVTLEIPQSFAAWQTRRMGLIKELRDKTFRWFPSNPPRFNPTPNGGHGGWLDRYGTYDDFQIQSEHDLSIRVQIIESKVRDPLPPLLIVIERPTDNLSFVDVDELLPLFGHCDVAIVNPRLTDRQLTSQEHTDFERTAVWSGRTLAALQAWDVLRATDWLTQHWNKKPRHIAILAKDEMTVPALYATLLAPDIDQLIVRHLPSTHHDAPPLLNVLRFTDIPEILAAIAPRTITYLGSKPKAFELTEAVFEMHPSKPIIASAMSLPEALFRQEHLERQP